MSKKKRNHFDNRLIIGLVVIVAGLMLLLQRLDLGVDIHLGDYWPVLLIVLGIAKILQPKHSRHIFCGFVLVGIGVLFQLNNLGIIDFWFDDLWPIFIILIGITIIRSTIWRPRFFAKVLTCDSDTGESCCGPFQNKNQSVDNDHVNISAIFGGGDYKISSKQFKGGNVTSIFAGNKLDFLHADIDGDRATLDTSVVFGSIELVIPSHWQVVIQAAPLLGSVENKTVSPKEPTKTLVVKGSAIIGSLEVKN